MDDFKFCNIGIEELIGKYYDKDGFTYYTNDDIQIYRFFLKIKYFSKLYNAEIKKSTAHNKR